LIFAVFIKGEFNLLAFGDIGQVDYFYNRNPKGKNNVRAKKWGLSLI